MNNRAIVGTLVWLVILFLVISATFFYMKFKDDKVDPIQNKSINKTNGENFSIDELALKNSSEDNKSQLYNLRPSEK